MYFDYSLVLREFASEFGMAHNSILKNKKGLVLVLTFFQENLFKNYWQQANLFHKISIFVFVGQTIP